MASQIPVWSFLAPLGLRRTATRLFPARNGYRPRRSSPSSSPSPFRTPLSSGCQRSSSTNSKSRVLSKPDKFRPPSHASRRVTKNKAPRNYPGPKLTAEEQEAKKTRKYPNMFPPEGTLMFRFLTNKSIHLFISMGVLFSLSIYTFTHNFKVRSPFAHLLPPWSGLIFHPFDTVGQFIAVLKMDAHHNTIKSKEARRHNVDDVDKRRAYRIAHGLEEPESATGEKKGEDSSTFADEEERPRRKPKKWLGIW